MNKTILAIMILSVIFILGCQPAAQPAAPAEPEPAPAEPEPAPEPAPAEPEAAPEPEAEAAPGPLYNLPSEPREGIDIEQACYGLLVAEDLATICGYENEVILSHKISEKGCWVNIADRFNQRLTAGFTVVDWGKAVESNEEFDRGVSMRKTQGAVEAQDVGERNYGYDEIDRRNVVWVRGSFLTRLGSHTTICPADKLVDLAKKIDMGMQ